MNIVVQRELIVAITLSVAACSVLGPFIINKNNSPLSWASGAMAALGAGVGSIFFTSLSSPWVILLAMVSSFFGILLAQFVRKILNTSSSNAFFIVSGLFLGASFFILNALSFSGRAGISSIIFGELAFIPLQRGAIASVDIGPIGLYSMAGVFLMICLLIWVFYKDIKISLLDPSYGACFYSWQKHNVYLLPFLTSAAAAVSVQAAGVFMTANFFLLPAAIGFLYTKRQSTLIIISVLAGVSSTLTGFGIAYDIKAAPSAAIVLVMAALFVFSLLFAPEKGLLRLYSLSKRQRETVMENIILTDLLNINQIDYITDYHELKVMSLRLGLKEEYLKFLATKLECDELVTIVNENLLQLTENGKIKAEKFVKKL